MPGEVDVRCALLLLVLDDDIVRERASIIEEAVNNGLNGLRIHVLPPSLLGSFSLQEKLHKRIDPGLELGCGEISGIHVVRVYDH